MTGKEKLATSKEQIVISNPIRDNIVMHIGEKYLMQKLADLATKNGGHILEIGFGMHLSADAVQSNPNVLSHTIIEVHPDQYEKALEWSKLQNKETNIILGDWIKILPLSNKQFDGVVHDTHLDPNIPKFLDYVKPNCKKGTIIAFFEYPKFDFRFNGYRVTLPKDEWESIPYKTNIHFKSNQFELKYTIFDGDDFYSEKIINKLL
jgi:hypothetical protein